jgi:galactokinase
MPERVAARGPGRVNLIGEHTDYNRGLAMPFAIERGVTVTAAARPGDEIEAHALDDEAVGREEVAGRTEVEPQAGDEIEASAHVRSVRVR